jgi:hypothetical protein
MNRTTRAPDLARIAAVGVVGAGFMGAQLALHIEHRRDHGRPVALGRERQPRTVTVLVSASTLAIGYQTPTTLVVRRHDNRGLA